MAEEDPRLAPPALAEVPGHVAEGAARYNAGRFWHAHESWELAWHGLRASGREDEAAYLQGLVFVTASFENLRRGRRDGFRRQLAKALARLEALPVAGRALGVRDEAAFLAALHRILAAAQARPVASHADLPEPPPALKVGEAGEGREGGGRGSGGRGGGER